MVEKKLRFSFLLLYSINVFFLFYNALAEFAPLSSNTLAHGISLLSSDQNSIKLIYRNKEPKPFHIYLAVPPVGDLQVRTINLLSKTTVEKEIASIEKPAFIRDLRVTKLTVNPTIQIGTTLHKFTELQIEIFTTETAQTIKKRNYKPQNFCYGLDRVLSKLLFNYKYNDKFRYKRDISYNEITYPGLIHPLFFSSKSHFLKLKVSKPGLYKIGYYELAKTVKPESIDPRTFQLFTLDTETNSVIEVALDVVGEKDGKFNLGDYIVFYGIPLNTAYTEERIYWLTWGLQSGLRMETKFQNSLDTICPHWFWNKLHFEENKIFEDSTIYKKDNWFWQVIEKNKACVIPISFYNLAPLYGQSTISINFYGKTNSKHCVAVFLNDIFLCSTSWVGKQECHLTTSLPYSYVTDAKNFLKITLSNSEKTIRGEDINEVYLNFIEVEYPRYIILEPEYYLEFISSEKGVSLEKIENLENTLFYFVNNPFKPIKIITQKCSNEPGHYVLATISAASTIVPQTRIPKKNLRKSTNSADYLIITHEKFTTAAQKLAQFRRKRNNVKVEIVDIQDIYDQFNYGIFDPRAIRYFLEYVYHCWKEPSPNYIVLIGDATSDYKHRLENNVFNFVPTYIVNHTADQIISSDINVFSSDLWYTEISGDDPFPDFVIGRISVCNETDAEAVVDKIIKYEMEPVLSEWKTRILLVSDDGFENNNSQLIQKIIPQYCKIERIDLRNYGFVDNFFLPSDTKSKLCLEGNLALLDFISKGNLITVYFGHGSPNVWAHERLLFGGNSKNSDVKKLNNGPLLHFSIELTCSTGQIDYPIPPWNICLAEDMLRAKNGGAIGLYVPTGKGFTPNHQLLCENLLKALFLDENTIVGEAISQAVIEYLFEKRNDNTPQMFVYLGDPLLKLAFPKHYVEIKATENFGNHLLEINGIVKGAANKFNVGEGKIWIKNPSYVDLDKQFLPWICDSFFSFETVLYFKIQKGKFSINLELPTAFLHEKYSMLIQVYLWNKDKTLDAWGGCVISKNTFTNASISIEKAQSTEAIKKLPDLAVSSTDLYLLKEKYIEGETVFLDVVVHNYGSTTAKNVEVVGYEGNPKKGGKLLSNMASWDFPIIDSLPPYTSKKVRLRWDAFNNAGDKEIFVVIDPHDYIKEEKEDNNMAFIKFHVNTKPNLIILHKEVVKQSIEEFQKSRTATLLAKIANIGESDAKNVVVQFYNILEDETKIPIGEEINIPVLKANEEKVIQTKWCIPEGLKKYNLMVEVGIKTAFEKIQDLFPQP